MSAQVGIKMFTEALVSIARKNLPEAGALVETGYKASFRELDQMHIHPVRIGELNLISSQLKAGIHQPNVEQALLGFIETLGG
ncbi:MAG: hypothetical protein H7287_07505 [Thermoleophilia bacterium]|nr:hypothetical protein [Thermoleophilia bacterium]